MKKLFWSWCILLLLPTLLFTQTLQRRAYFGTATGPIPKEMAEKIDRSTGIWVKMVLEDGTGYQIGLQKDDIITKINGKVLNSHPEFQAYRSHLKGGTPIQIEVWRNQEFIQLNGTAVARPYENPDFTEVIYDEVPYRQGQLRSIIYTPNKTEKHPTIFFIPGYTCSVYDNMVPNHPTRKLLDSLGKLGYAIVRVEKPGMGDSHNTGNCFEIGFNDEVEAFEKGFESLAKYDFIDQNNIFILGHSMGGVYAPLIAKKYPVKGVITYGSTHEKWTEYLLRMLRFQNPRLGEDYLVTEDKMTNFYALLYEQYHLKKPAKELVKNPDFAPILLNDFQFDGEDQLIGRHEKFWLELSEQNITEAWINSNAFVLSIYGGADLQALDEYSHQEIVRMVNSYRPGTAQYIYRPSANHFMVNVGPMEKGVQIMGTPQAGRYFQQNFDYKIVNEIHHWILDKLSKTIKDPVALQYDWYHQIDPFQLQESNRNYDIIQNGTVKGRMVFEKIKDGNDWFFRDTSELFGQVWETLNLHLDPLSFQMKRASIELKAGATQLEGSLSFDKKSVKGHYEINQNREHNILKSAKYQVLGRPAIFGLVEALPLQTGAKYYMELFAFSSGDIWEMLLEVIGQETIEINGTTVNTWKLSLTGGAVDNNLYLSADEHQKLLQVDVIGQDMVIKLKSES